MIVKVAIAQLPAASGALAGVINTIIDIEIRWTYL
jgi:hypothetical protein